MSIFRNLNFKKTISAFLSLLILASVFSAIFSFYAVSAENNSQTIGDKPRIMVSLGDSYSSGEGIPEFYGQLDKYGNSNPIQTKGKNLDWLAHRSTKSWSGLLKLNGVSGTMADHWFNYNTQNYDDANWYFVASSGAVTYDLGEPDVYSEGSGQEKSCNRDGFSNSVKLDKQLYIFKKLRDRQIQADYVTVTIGGNDVDFVGVVASAITPEIVFFNPGGVRDKLADSWNKFYNDTENDNGGTDKSVKYRLQQAYRDISKAAGNQAKIIVAGYPKLFKSGIDIDVKVKFGFDLTFTITKEEIACINESVTRFNQEINAIVNSCKSEGIKITFVPVEDAFGDNGAYAHDALINPCYVGETKSEDLNEVGNTEASSYSMHPNEEGAKVYAKCVQAKIDSIEKDGGKSEWPDMTSSDERDIVLVLDTSGSMDGKPMEEVVKASGKFVDTVLKEEASIGVVAYDNSSLTICNFCKNKKYLVDSFSKLNAYGGTNIESGLKRAEEMLDESSAKKKIIVLMSDGQPNDGKLGDDLIEYAESLRDKGIYIYTLGFFSSLYSSDRAYAQDLMKSIAGDESFYFDIDDADNIVYFFGDIADQISGQKYIYIRIACPVDVTVAYNGETLSSKESSLNKRTSFGSLTLEENVDDSDGSAGDADGEVDTVKILRLKNGVDYDISIKGTGRGRMDYTIGFMDDNGEYSDMRTFSNIKITRDTVIDTVATEAEKTVLNVDEDGDGKYDLIYEAGRNGKGKLVEKSYAVYIVLGVIGVLIIACIGALVIISKKRKNSIKI